MGSFLCVILNIFQGFLNGSSFSSHLVQTISSYLTKLLRGRGKIFKIAKKKIFFVLWDLFFHFTVAVLRFFHLFVDVLIILNITMMMMMTMGLEMRQKAKTLKERADDRRRQRRRLWIFTGNIYSLNLTQTHSISLCRAFLNISWISHSQNTETEKYVPSVG